MLQRVDEHDRSMPRGLSTALLRVLLVVVEQLLFPIATNYGHLPRGVSRTRAGGDSFLPHAALQPYLPTKTARSRIRLSTRENVIP